MCIRGGSHQLRCRRCRCCCRFFVFPLNPSSRRPLRLASIAVILAESRFSRLSYAADPLSLSLSLSYFIFCRFITGSWKLLLRELRGRGPTLCCMDDDFFVINVLADPSSVYGFFFPSDIRFFYGLHDWFGCNSLADCLHILDRMNLFQVLRRSFQKYYIIHHGLHMSVQF